MKKLKNIFLYFSKFEQALWCSSVCLIIIAFTLFDRVNYLMLIASLIGTTSLIFNAKGNSFGQFLMIIFSILYAVISYGFAYYGEMITYVGMTAPMALFALISWMKNPYNGNKTEVATERIKLLEILLMLVGSGIITVVFLLYFNNV